MSLSRRYLSLPQELIGCFLPPQVSGKQRGTVTLCVAHILPSAVSCSPLPRVTLVRVRWWGEETPGSLFRPNLLSDDSGGNVEAQDSPHRIITMKYPVSVLSEHLLEYFQDMEHLTLDVIDRDSRRKIGQCLLLFDLAKNNEVMTAAEKLVALRRDNVLCEIKPCNGETAEVVGYLAVTFKVEWVSDHVPVNSDINNVDEAELAALSSLSYRTRASDLKQTRKKVEVEQQRIENKKHQKNGSTRMELYESKRHKSCDHSQRIQRLLEKGKALQQSMERAVDGNNANIEAEDEDNFAPSHCALNNGIKEVHGGSDTSMCFQSQLDVPALDDGHDKVKQKLVSTIQPSNPESPPEPIALVITFESLKLDRKFVDLQLRQLRDSACISRRCSPIQIHVSHNMMSSLLISRRSAERDLSEIPAFAVSTSLRKRHWQLGFSSRMSLTRPWSHIKVDNGNVKPLRFYVRCENHKSSDARRKKRRRKQNCCTRSSKCILLEGAVDATKLFAVAKQGDKTWATTVQLRLKSDGNQAAKSYAVGANRQIVKTGRPCTTKLHSAGNLKVGFAFHTVAPSEQSSASKDNSEAESEMPLSSIRSISGDQVGAAVKDLFVSDVSVHQLPRETQPIILCKPVVNDGSHSIFSFQFAVMLEDVSKINALFLRDNRVQLHEPKDLVVNDNIGRKDYYDNASISVHYAVPSIFSQMSPLANKIERTNTRKLSPSQWFNSTSFLYANFGGKTHIFQSSFAGNSSDYFSNGHLIFETWVQLAKDAERRLVGLAKMPLRQLAGLLSKDTNDLLSLSEKSFPFVDVCGCFPIENPFTGHLSGYLRARACIGTAEQLFTWIKIIQTVVKVQGKIRGVLSRRQLCRFTTPRTALRPESLNIPSQLVVNVNGENRFDSQSTAPIHTTITSGHDVIRSCSKADASEYKSKLSPEDEKTYKAALLNESSLFLRKICFELRESWQSATQSYEYKEDHGNYRGWSISPILGCELQGQLVLTGTLSYGGKVNDLPFSLWWDAADRNLNSTFIHTFQARGQVKEDLAILGPQSHVLFALHVENGFFGRHSRETITGEARFNLYEKLTQHGTKGDSTMQTTEREGSHVHVDVPIVWNRERSGYQRLPSAIPIAISYHLSQSTNMTVITGMNAASLEEAIVEDSSVKAGHQFGASIISVPDKRLKPASLELYFHLLSMDEFQSLLDETSRRLIVDLLDNSNDHFRDMLETNYEARCVCFETTICLGNDLHELEKRFRQEEYFPQDLKLRVFLENGKWYKHWRSPDIIIPAASENQTKTFENFFIRLHMLLNPDTVATLQHDCAQVAVLLSCSICCEPHRLGCIEVPLAAVLYRPQGVCGMFSIRVGQAFSAARLSVHCFVNHTDSSIPSTGAFQEMISPPLLLPTSPDEMTSVASDLLILKSRRSCKVCIEEARNLVVNSAETTPHVFFIFRMTRQSSREAGRYLLISLTKRTDVKVSPDLKWDYWDVLDVEDVDWQDCLLEVSAWHDDSNNYTTEDESGERLHLNQRKSDIFVGSTLIDLSLFHRGWRDIDGWYHIENAQRQTRGQVKVHVRNLSLEDQLKGAKPLVSSWNSRYQNELVGNFDAATTLPTLNSAVQAVNQAFVEVEAHLARLHPSDHELSSAIEIPRAYMDVVFTHNTATNSQENTPRPSVTTPSTEQDLMIEANAETHNENLSADLFLVEANDHEFTCHASKAMSDDYYAVDNGTCGSEFLEISVNDVESLPLLRMDDSNLPHGDGVDNKKHASSSSTPIVSPALYDSKLRDDAKAANVFELKLEMISGTKEGKDYEEVIFQSSDSEFEEVTRCEFDCLWEELDMPSKENEHFHATKLLATNTVPSCNVEKDDVSCEKGIASIATESIVDDDAKDIQRLNCTTPIHDLARQYADKAIQVDSFELGLQVAEMGACSVQTKPTLKLEKKTVIDAAVNVNSCYEEDKGTADVGCNVMEDLDTSSLSPFQSNKEERQPLFPTKIELDGVLVKLLEAFVGINSKSCAASDAQSSTSSKSVKEKATCELSNMHSFGIANTTLQNEKLDMMYEMLRDMRESFVVAKTASIGVQEEKSKDCILLTERIISIEDDDKETDAKCSSCPSSPISKKILRKKSWDKRAFGSAPGTIQVKCSDKVSKTCSSCPIAQDLTSPKLKDTSYDIAPTTRVMKTGTMPNTLEKTAFEMQVNNSSLDTKKSVPYDRSILHTLLKSSDESKKNRETSGSIQRRQNMFGFQTQFGEHKSQYKERQNQQPMDFLFMHDSETERIARIMQGSMEYWMKDDKSSSSDDQFKEDESEADCYF